MTTNSLKEFYAESLGISPAVSGFCEKAEGALADRFRKADLAAEFNQAKVLSAMRKNRLSEAHFGYSTGYGYNDIGRDALENIYADVFGTEAALVRPQLISGTNALHMALSGNLRHGDEMLSAVGAPYDTLKSVIGIRETRSSLIERGVIYKQADLLPGGGLDFEGIKAAITAKTRLVLIQRSKGYSLRPSLTFEDVKALVAFVKGIKKDIICLVDNCYCEFVDTAEPGEAGADIVVGSLIKNPGGGLAPAGGYIAGKTEFVDNAAFMLTAPGLGREAGPTLGLVRNMAQGLFLAPCVVASALKGAVFAAEVFSRLGYEISPKTGESRADIVQAVTMRSPEELICFCRGVQKAAPVDSFAVPEPWDMPGYGCDVIMAAGAFVQGASIEQSADAPLRPPYAVFLQGGLTWQHAKIGVMTALAELINAGFVSEKQLGESF